MNTPISFELAKILFERHGVLLSNISDVVMWLYEKHGVWITVCVIGADGFGYWLHDKDRKRLNSDNQGGYWLLPTKAYEAAIKYCLEKII